MNQNNKTGYTSAAGARFAVAAAIAAFAWCAGAAELEHDVDAHYVTGLCRRYGMGIRKDVPLAMKAFRMAARRGHVDACRQIGECHAENGHMVWAVAWYRKGPCGFPRKLNEAVASKTLLRCNALPDTRGFATASNVVKGERK